MLSLSGDVKAAVSIRLSLIIPIPTSIEPDLGCCIHARRSIRLLTLQFWGFFFSPWFSSSSNGLGQREQHLLTWPSPTPTGGTWLITARQPLHQDTQFNYESHKLLFIFFFFRRRLKIICCWRFTTAELSSRRERPVLGGARWWMMDKGPFVAEICIQTPHRERDASPCGAVRNATGLFIFRVFGVLVDPLSICKYLFIIFVL